MDPERPITHEQVESWVAAYERAWRSEGTEALASLFTEGAGYRMSPYEQAAVGRAAIAALWERERKGPDEKFEMRHRIVAVEARTAVVRVSVEYGTGAEYRDLWVIRFADDDRCSEFEEWPFWPGRPVAP